MMHAGYCSDRLWMFHSDPAVVSTLSLAHMDFGARSFVKRSAYPSYEPGRLAQTQVGIQRSYSRRLRPDRAMGFWTREAGLVII